MRRSIFTTATALTAAALLTAAGSASAGVTAINANPRGGEPSVASLLAGFAAGGSVASAASATAPVTPAPAGFTRVDDSVNLRFASGATYEKLAGYAALKNVVNFADGTFSITNGKYGTLTDGADDDGADHAVAFKADGSDTYYLFFEDTAASLADLDFNDVVVRVDGATAVVPVPPAAVAGLLTMGGLGTLRTLKRLRRRHA